MGKLSPEYAWLDDPIDKKELWESERKFKTRRWNGAKAHADTQEEPVRQAEPLPLPTAAELGLETSNPAAALGWKIGTGIRGLINESHIDPEKSKLGYLGEKIAGGAASAMEGMHNFLVDAARAKAEADFRTQQLENDFYAGIDDAHAKRADVMRKANEDAINQLSGGAEAMRSHKAAEYAAGIDERYDARGLWKLGGDVASGVGQMVPTIGANLATGGVMGLPMLSASAAGNAAAQARQGGADENTALVYGVLSGGVEVATEKMFGGIPGLGKTGMLDNVIGKIAKSPAGKAAVKKIGDVLGEGAEEYISEIAGAYLAKMWNGDDRGAWQTFVETQPEALYAGLLGSLTSAAMNLPGYAKDGMNTWKNYRGAASDRLGAKNAAENSVQTPAVLPIPKQGNAYNDSFTAPTQEKGNNTLDFALPQPENRVNAKEDSWLIGFPLPQDASMQNSQKDAAENPFDYPLPETVAQEIDRSDAVQLPLGEKAQNYYDSDAARGQAIQAGKASAQELDAVEHFAKSKKLAVRYIYEENSLVDGFIHDNVMTVNLASDASFFGTAVHEAGHSMAAANTAKYTKFKNAVLRLAENDTSLQEYANKVRESYTAPDSPALASVTREDGRINSMAVEEEVSLKLAEQIISDPEKLTAAVEHDRNLIESFLDFVRGIKNSLAVRRGDRQAMLDEAERTLVNLLRGETGRVEDTRFSIKRDALGNPFVEIDEDILSGVANKDKTKIVKEEMKRRYPNGFNWRGWNIMLNATGRKEFTNSEYTKKIKETNKRVFNDKLRTAANLDEIIETANNIRNEDLHHPRKDNIKSFNRADIRIRVGKNEYSAEVVTGIKEDTKEIFYDIINLQPTKMKDAIPNQRNANSQSLEITGAHLSNNTVSNPTQEVKGKKSLSVPFLLPSGESLREHMAKEYGMQYNLPIKTSDLHLNANEDADFESGAGMLTQDEEIRAINAERNAEKMRAAQESSERKMHRPRNLDDVPYTDSVQGALFDKPVTAAVSKRRNETRDIVIQHPPVDPVNNTAGAKEILAAEQEKGKLEGEFRQLASAHAATATEIKNAKQVAEGTIEIDDIGRRDREDVVRQLAEVHRNMLDAKERGVTGTKKQILTFTLGKYKGMLSGINDKLDTFTKRPLTEIGLNARTPERVLRKAFGQELGGQLAEDIITPIHYNESNKIQFINEMFSRARALDLNETERRLTQLIGEKVTGTNGKSITVDDVRKGNIGPDSLPGFMEKNDAKALLEHLSQANADKVQKAVDFYRKTYDELFDVINEFRVSRGLTPIKKKADYFPHFVEDDVLTKTLKQFGIEGVSSLPTSIAGKTAFNRPNSRWVRFLQQRMGTKTSFDSDLGFQQYIMEIADMLYHTDDILKLRSLDAVLRGQYSNEELGNTIDSIITKKQMGAAGEFEAAALEKVLNGEYMDMEAGAQYGALAKWLTEYTNKLANKQLMMDRGVEAAVSRMALNIPGKIQNAYSRNAVVGNLSSGINNIVALPKITTLTSAKDVANAVRGIANGEFKALGLEQESEFLMGKKGVDPLIQSKMQKLTKKIGDKTFEPVEALTGNIAFYAKYLNEIRSGIDEQTAIYNADLFAGNMMARRTKGARPLFMESRNPIIKLTNAFQMEVSNDFFTLIDDLPQMYKEKLSKEGKAAAAADMAEKFAKYCTYSFLLNTVLESVTGYASAPDPARWLWEFFRDLANKDDDETELRNTVNAVGGLVENVGQIVPGLSAGLAMFGHGNGRIPLPEFQPDRMLNAVDALMSSDEEMPNRKKYAAQEMWKGAVVPAGMLLLPFGGNQLKKTTEGLATMARGGAYTEGKEGSKLQTSVDSSLSPQGMLNWARAAAFGKGAIKEVSDYYDSGRRPLSASRTANYEKAKEEGVGQEYLDMLGAVDADKNGTITQEEAKKYLDGKNLSREQKAKLFAMMNKDWKSNPYQ